MSHLLYLWPVLLRIIVVDVLHATRQTTAFVRAVNPANKEAGVGPSCSRSAAHLACHRVEAVVPAVERHPDGRDDVPPPLAGVLQRVLQVVQTCSAVCIWSGSEALHSFRRQLCCELVVPFAALESMSLAASPGGLCQLLSRPFTCSQTMAIRIQSTTCIGWCQITQERGSGSAEQAGASTYQALGEGVDVAEGLETGEVRPDPGDGYAD